MTQKQINRIIKLLKAKGVVFEKGLEIDEVDSVEGQFGIAFPPDLKLLLKTELPVSKGFVNWRYGINSEKGKQEIINRLNWPREGILFDVDNNSFWLKEWGNKPTSIKERKEYVTNKILEYPKLIPIYSHRYIPSTPCENGNPVLSVYQTDIIYYGYDLAEYFAHEFKFKLPESFGLIEIPKAIKFWSRIINMNC